MGAKTEDGRLAAKILDEYMQDFQRRNPTLRVFSAHLHMDEATPHLHIDLFERAEIHNRKIVETIKMCGVAVTMPCIL